MSGCVHCSGDCGSCNSCGNSLTINQAELHMLRKLAQIPFLPVARRMDSTDPVYLEDQDYSREEYALILLSLEKKGLITIDFDIPLKGFCAEVYSAYPIVGSFALSSRGQRTLEILDLQGVQ